MRNHRPVGFSAALAAVCLLGTPIPLLADITVEQLVTQARLVEADVAMRDRPRWEEPRKIVIRDVGLDLSALATSYTGIEFVHVASQREALDEIADADAIIGYCDEEILNAGKKLAWVQIYSSGAERCVGSPGIVDGDVVLSNMQKMASPMIAEHAVAMMMSLARKLPQYVRTMDDGAWDARQNRRDGMQSIVGKRLLVVGLGGIGMETARLSAALGMRVSGTRNSSRDGPDFVEYVGLGDELHELASDADFIVAALPLTPKTTGLFGKKFFDSLKPGAIFINVGRGRSVVTDDLIAALESGQLGGVGLDVTEPEPLPPQSPLWNMHNVIITPHVSTVGGENERHRVLVMENLRRYIAGDALLNVVDPTRGY